jgi:5-hydroxyisourate hydrolase
MKIELWAIDENSGERTPLKTVYTNEDGRTDDPLLADDDLSIGVYELVFSVGEYFKPSGESMPEPMFLSQVPIRFGVADSSYHYHVPLLTSPWSYSTYRGS